MVQSKSKDTKIQSIPTSVVTISPPITSTVTSLTGGQAIQQHITLMQHQQHQKQQEHQQKHSNNTKNDTQSLDHQDHGHQHKSHQLQTLLDMQKSIIITNHAGHQQHHQQQQQQHQSAIQQISDHHLIQSSQDSLPITILRTSSQNINSGVHLHQLSASTDQHSIVY